MKKSISLFLMMIFVFSLIGCGGRATEIETPTTNDSDASTEVNSESTVSTEVSSETSESTTTSEQDTSEDIQVDEGLLNITITLPASLFDVTDFDPDAYTEENGFKETVVNDDGTVSITMSKRKHNEVMAEFKVETDKTLEDMIESEDTPYIKAINSSDGYRTVTVYVDKPGYEASFDMTPFMIGLSAMFYQQFDGADLHCEVIIRDVESGEILNSVIYPDALED